MNICPSFRRINHYENQNSSRIGLDNTVDAAYINRSTSLRKNCVSFVQSGISSTTSYLFFSPLFILKIWCFMIDKYCYRFSNIHNLSHKNVYYFFLQIAMLDASKFDSIDVKDVWNHISIIIGYHWIYIWSKSRCIMGKILVKIMKRYYW